MPINQPPFKSDQSQASWEYELTTAFNRNEEKLLFLLKAILQANDINELKALVKDL